MPTLRIGNDIVTPVIVKEVPSESSIQFSVYSNGKIYKSNTTFKLPEGGVSLDSDSLQYAFYGNHTLTAVDFSNLTDIQGNMQGIFQNSGIQSVDLSGLVNITGGNIQNAFYCCNLLQSIDLSNLTTISGSSSFNNVFSGCTSLATLNLPKLTSIVSNASMTFKEAFRNCSALSTISAPLLTTINAQLYDTFWSCTSLATLNLPSITNLAYSNVFQYAFESCSNLTEVTIGNANSPIDFGTYIDQFNHMFYKCDQNITLNIGTSIVKLSTMTGYDSSGNGHHFDCTGVVTLNTLSDVTINLNITGTWNFIYIDVDNKTYDNTTTSFPFYKETSTKYAIETPNGIYIGKIPATTSSSYTLSVDLTTVTYDTITLQPNPISTFMLGNIKFGKATSTINSTTLSANVYNSSSENVDLSYIYLQTEYKANIGTTTYSSGALSIPLTMTPGAPIWIEPVSGYTYPWRVAETVVAPTGYSEYESTNWHKGNSKSVSKLCFAGTSFTCYINSFGESTWDYTIISTVDAETVPTTDTAETAYRNTKGNQKDPSIFPGNYTQVDYTGLTNDLHYVYIVYVKDSDGDQNNDRGYLVF